MIKIDISNDKNKVKNQIKVLEHLIKNDTNEKDKEIHKRALDDLKRMNL